MNIYVDESGSINNHIRNNEYFVIAMVRVVDGSGLKKAYKRFISGNIERLKELDRDKVGPGGNIVKAGNKMFQNGKFKELKGSQLDRDMKIRFMEFFGKKPEIEVYYVVLKNPALTDSFCKNTARAFNFSLKNAFLHFIRKGYLPQEDCHLQLDERNEKTETKYFLENYLNTELVLAEEFKGEFTVRYFDSSNNKFVQIADVFANIMWSELKTHGYTRYLERLKEEGIIKCIYEFPLHVAVEKQVDM